MTSWVYTADGGESYPVQPGDLWTVGRHALLCGDVEAGAVERLLSLSDLTPALAYVDLPYRASDARAYRTKAGVDGGKGRPVDYGALVRAALRPIAALGCPIYAETGLSSIESVWEAGALIGADLSAAWTITYYGDKPAGLLVMNALSCDLPSLEGVDDERTPALAIEAHTSPGDAVIDPMMGRGLTAVSAARLGRVALGVELHPARLSVTLAKLADLLDVEPVRASRT